MDAFLEQAIHNKNFLSCIEQNFPDDFYDWRITVMFYIAIHLLKTLGNQRGVNIGETHYEIATSLNPKRSNKQIFPFPPWAWTTYSTIFQYSRDSRYNGISNKDIVKIAQKRNYEECVSLLGNLCKYMESNGINL